MSLINLQTISDIGVDLLPGVSIAVSLIVDIDVCEGEAALVEFMVFIWLIVALLTAYIAWAKRRAWYLWLIAGLILGILALFAVIGMPTRCRAGASSCARARCASVPRAAS
jgi:hypothetical protein